MYTIAEMIGLGVCTVCTIVLEVCEIIVNEMWNSSVDNLFPKTKEQFQDCISDFEELWQFPYAFAAIDGCHLPIKCPPGGREANKEYHNFKEFFSIVLMALVDAKGRFIWANCGIPGNTHDSLIFQSSNLYRNVVDGKIIPQLNYVDGGIEINPLIIGDSAFEFNPWMMKHFTDSVLTKEQRYFNYRLSRARMIIEGAFGLWACINAQM